MEPYPTLVKLKNALETDFNTLLKVDLPKLSTKFRKPGDSPTIMTKEKQSNVIKLFGQDITLTPDTLVYGTGEIATPEKATSEKTTPEKTSPVQKAPKDDTLEKQIQTDKDF